MLCQLFRFVKPKAQRLMEQPHHDSRFRQDFAFCVGNEDT